MCILCLLELPVLHRTPGSAALALLSLFSKPRGPRSQGMQLSLWGSLIILLLSY